MSSRSGPAASGTPLSVFLNPGSGRGSSEAEAVGEAFQAAGLAVDLRPVEPDELADQVRGAVAAGADQVGICGGDGTASTAAGVLAGTDTALVVCPGGTLNHFAVALGIETHADAAEAVAAGRYERVDVGEVNGRIFVNGASIGAYPRSLRIREKWEPKVGKWGAATVAAAAVLLDIRDRVVRLEGPDLDDARLAPLVWVGPGEGSFGSPRRQARALHSETLELVVLNAESGWRLLRLAFSALRHGGDALLGCAEMPDCSARRLEAFALHARDAARIDLGIDGELARMEPPLRFRSRPGALRVARGAGEPSP